MDFGGTKLALGLADERGKLLGFRRRPTDAAAAAPGAVQAMHEMAAELGAQSGTVAGVGISFGGPVAVDRQRTLLSHHGPGWENVHLVREVADVWGVPVEMDNDANAAALGEVRFGAGQGQRNVLYVTVSTGIGGGVVLDGELYRGSRGLSGEIGHTIVQPGGPVCACGKRGCLEAVAAGPALGRAYAELASQPVGSVTGEEVFRLAAAGDPVAARVLAEAIEYLGIGLANAINLLDPDLVVVGGGVSRAGDRLFVPLRQAVRAACAPSPPDGVPVVPAALGDAVGVLGAVALVAGTNL
jgi:glucokinase